MTTDIWYNPVNFEEVDQIDWTFYPGEGYRGNMYCHGEVVGDYTADSIQEIKSVFPWIFED